MCSDIELAPPLNSLYRARGLSHWACPRLFIRRPALTIFLWLTLSNTGLTGSHGFPSSKRKMVPIYFFSKDAASLPLKSTSHMPWERCFFPFGFYDAATERGFGFSCHCNTWCVIWRLEHCWKGPELRPEQSDLCVELWSLWNRRKVKLAGTFSSISSPTVGFKVQFVPAASLEKPCIFS